MVIVCQVFANAVRNALTYLNALYAGRLIGGIGNAMMQAHVKMAIALLKIETINQKN